MKSTSNNLHVNVYRDVVGEAKGCSSPLKRKLSSSSSNSSVSSTISTRSPQKTTPNVNTVNQSVSSNELVTHDEFDQDLDDIDDIDIDIDDDNHSTIVTKPNECRPINQSYTLITPTTRLNDDINIDHDNSCQTQRQLDGLPLATSSSPPPLTADTLNCDSNYVDPAILRSFYQRLFPFRYLFQWLNHSPVPTTSFTNREFAFTLQNDVYLRYQSFRSVDLLRRQCIDMVPSRFEIGPVYTTNPRDRKSLPNSTVFRPIEKELVFDIDLTDYDSIRTCCSGANLCTLCWDFIIMAIKTIDVALREDFGFVHILWVYSGRRGVHAWVCDRKARMLDDTARKAISGYLEIFRGGEWYNHVVNSVTTGKKPSSGSGANNSSSGSISGKMSLHPHIERSLNILRPYFKHNILEKHNVWQTPEGEAKLLSHLSAFPSVTKHLQQMWKSSPGRSSALKWGDIDSCVSVILNTARDSSTNVNGNINKIPGILDVQALVECKQRIILEYTYARLDAEVSKRKNHLLKSPFVVHPGTGRVCLPINLENLSQFDPLSVPTVKRLLEEIDEWDDQIKYANSSENSHLPLDSQKSDQSDEPALSVMGKRVLDWEKTRLKPYIEYFRDFVTQLLKHEKELNDQEVASLAQQVGLCANDNLGHVSNPTFLFNSGAKDSADAGDSSANDFDAFCV